MKNYQIVIKLEIKAETETEAFLKAEDLLLLSIEEESLEMEILE